VYVHVPALSAQLNETTDAKPAPSVAALVIAVPRKSACHSALMYCSVAPQPPVEVIAMLNSVR